MDANTLGLVACIVALLGFTFRDKLAAAWGRVREAMTPSPVSQPEPLTETVKVITMEPAACCCRLIELRENFRSDPEAMKALTVLWAKAFELA